MTSRRLLSPVAKILLDAADYMEEHGHAKRSLRENDGRVCLAGAINMVTCGTMFGDDSQPIRMARERVRSHLGCASVWAAVQWNNADERTQEEVVSALRAAALEEGESSDA